MKIKWLGHSTFQIKSNASLVMDPYGPEIGELPKGLTADVVTISHNHYDHNFSQGVVGNPKIINQTGDFNIDGFEIKGVPTKHDNEGGNKRGNNIVYCVAAEGLKLCHLGDLGHALTEQQLQEIGKIDVLMVPVGGYYTIDAKTAVQVVNQIKPKLVLPMHYKPENSSISLPIAGVEQFNKLLGWDIVKVDELEVSQSSLPPKNREIILSKQHII